jgi:hypothetical protein
MEEKKLHDIMEVIELIPEMPTSHLVIYARLWQFETWLRQMVYVELRARNGNEWRKHLVGINENVKKSDKKLTYMPKPENVDFSFVTFGSLTKTISKKWFLFKDYLPLKAIWVAKVEDISQIRNRIAHFRTGHIDDSKRVIQLLRDVDKGFFKFCTSLNQSVHSRSVDIADPVIYEFAELNLYIKRDVLDTRDSIYSHFSKKLEIKIEITKRPWIKTKVIYPKVLGKPGFFYDLNIHIHDNHVIRYEDLLKSTFSLHDSILYIILSSSGNHLRVIVPSLLGKEMLIAIFEAFINASANNLWPGKAISTLSKKTVDDDIDVTQRVADKWPEYVIGPKNPISFLCADMDCSFFGA